MFELGMLKRCSIANCHPGTNAPLVALRGIIAPERDTVVT
jgi:hypothetical protein